MERKKESIECRGGTDRGRLGGGGAVAFVQRDSSHPTLV